MLPCLYRVLSFLVGSKIRRDATNVERLYRTDSRCPHFAKQYNQEYYLVPREVNRRLYSAVPPSWRGYKPCRALAIPSIPVFAYQSNSMVVLEGASMAGKETRRVYAGCRCRPCCHGSHAILGAYVAVVEGAYRGYAGL